MQRAIHLLCLVTLVSTVLVGAAAGQQGPPLGFVNKLGVEVDVRSNGRILGDELSASHVILPDLKNPVAGMSECRQYHRFKSAAGTSR
jgi:hypothetical protein